MSRTYWPLFELSLTTPELELRPMTEADLPLLGDLLPDDAELDPDATRFTALDEPTSRAVVLHQAYWRAYGTWTAEQWRLSFVVRHEGQVVGVQELEGNDFVRLRTVDSSSFLVPGARGRGLGQQMRRAVLGLAFGPLEAQAAITSAWHDNHASLGVSRALGYQPNGEVLHRRGDGVDVMVHLRLTRAQWDAAGPTGDLTIVGFEPCRSLFGVS